MNVSQIIAAFGGYSEACELLGVKRSTLALWEVEGIPAKRWRQVARIATRFANAQTPITFEIVSKAVPSKPAAIPSEAA